MDRTNGCICCAFGEILLGVSEFKLGLCDDVQLQRRPEELLFDWWGTMRLCTVVAYNMQKRILVKENRWNEAWIEL